jgi:hypothetical protein
MPVILAIQEAEIRKTQDPVSKKLITKKGWWSGLNSRAPA